MEILTLPLQNCCLGALGVLFSWHCLKVLQHERQDPKIQRVDGNLDPNPAIQCIGLLDPNCLVSEGKHSLYTTSLQIGIQNSSK